MQWEHVDEVNRRLLEGESPRKISAWCEERGFSISHPKLYEYKELLQESIARNVAVQRLLGIPMGEEEEESVTRKSMVLQALGATEDVAYVKNEMDMLDKIIHLGMTEAMKSPSVKIETAMKAIELKNKLTGGKHGGLTNYGLDHLKALESAKMEAIIQVVTKYLPEDKREELALAVAEAERSFYENNAPELMKDYLESSSRESANAELDLEV